MNPVSTGTGLCALAGAVLLYPLLHRAAPQAGALNAASAESVSGATRSRPSALQPPFAPTPPSLPPMGGGGMRPDGGVAMQVGGAGGCEYVLGEPLNWFTEAHPLPSCALNWALLLIEPLDLDGDGTRDFLTWLTRLPSDQLCDEYYQCVSLGGNSFYAEWGRDFNGQTWDSSDGQLTEGTGMFRHSLSVNGESVTVTVQQVASTAVLQSAICAVIPCGSQFGRWVVYPSSFRDMDGDGDLDLLVSVWWLASDYANGGGGWIWLENTVKNNPPLAADINGDGIIDGKDLAMVLSAWTP